MIHRQSIGPAALRIVITVSTLVLVSTGAAAAQGLEAGARAGVNFSEVNFEEDPSGFAVEGRTAGVVGGFVAIPLFGPALLQPEVLYSAKGGAVEAGGIRTAVHLEYLDVPVLLRLQFGGERRIRYYAIAGPSFGFRLRARSRTTFGGTTEEIDIADDVERLDAGVAAGFGIQVRRLVFDVRYTYGLSDIDADTNDAVALKNRTLSLTAGFIF